MTKLILKSLLPPDFLIEKPKKMEKQKDKRIKIQIQEIGNLMMFTLSHPQKSIEWSQLRLVPHSYDLRVYSISTTPV